MKEFIQSKYMLLVLSVFLTSTIAAQCPPGIITLSSQAQIDQFIIDYPECTELQRLDVTLGADITNVNGLSNLEKINGDLNITHNPLLNDLSGFGNIRSTGYLWISNNSSLVNLNAFPNLENAYWLFIGDHSNLESISGFNKLNAITNLTFINNSKLTSASGINELTQISGQFEIQNNPLLHSIDFATGLTQLGGHLIIKSNPVLQSLVTMDGITSINGALNLSGNASLANLNAFNSLSSINGQLIIEENTILNNISGVQFIDANSINSQLIILNNPVLTVCDLPNICTYLQGIGPRTISGNSGDCVTEQAVIDQCNAPAAGCLNITSTIPQWPANTFVPVCSGVDEPIHPQCETGEYSKVQVSAGTAYTFSSSVNTDYVTISDEDGENVFAFGSSGLLWTAPADGIIRFYLHLDDQCNTSTVQRSRIVLCSSQMECPTADVILNTQAQVNQFIADFPDCTELPANLFIGIGNGVSDITDLSPLSGLTRIGGWLAVYNTTLTNLNGLNNLTVITLDIDIRGNTVLNDISALQNTSFAPNSGFGLTILTNPLLSVCDLPSFCLYLNNPSATHPRNISGNSGDCATEQAVVEACNNTEIPDGEYCNNALEINNLFGKALNEPQNSQTYTTEGYDKLNDPSFGQECLGTNNTIWFKFTGDGQRYAVRSRDCSSALYTNPNGAMYSGGCTNLNAIECNRDIWTGDVDPDINFRIVVQTEPGQEYYLMVEVSTTDDFEIYNEYGNFCLEVTRLDPECLLAIPDINFKAYLIENAEINTNIDDEIQCEEAENFFGAIDCSGLGIMDLTGIEAFINLTQLNCSDNELTALNVLDNTSLWLLNCGGNDLTAIDFSKILWLEELVVNDNKITSLDLSGNVKISYFLANNNNLSRLDLANGNNTLFNTIHAHNNPALTCIKVDDADYSNTNWTGTNFLFDDQHTFNESCNPCEEIGKEVDATFLVGSSGCVGDSIHFIDYTIVDFEAEQIQFSWDFGDGNTSLQRDPVHIYADQGDHLVSLTVDIPGCESILMNKSIRILNCLKKDNGQQGYSRVMPNPTTGAFRLESRLPLTGDVSVKIYNTEGRQVYARQHRNTDHVSDDILFGKPGTYVAEILHLLGVDKVKIIILR